MSNVIDFPNPNAPDPDKVYIDPDGQVWFQYAVRFEVDEKPFEFEIWALSEEDAERRLEAIHGTGKVAGQILGTVPV